VGSLDRFKETYENADEASVIEFLIFDPANPSSIRSCIESARTNARAVRTALTADMWQSINSAWLELRALEQMRAPFERMSRERTDPFLDVVKSMSRDFDGAAYRNMLRNDAYWFSRLGTFVERADNTARILDVKYHALLPEYESIGGIYDYYQWTAILRSVSALRSYHWVYRDRLKPWLIAELLILRPEMPRSLISCSQEITQLLDLLDQSYGTRGECHRLAGRLHARLRFGKIDDIFQGGLHEFLTEFIDANVILGDEIARHYLF